MINKIKECAQYIFKMRGEKPTNKKMKDYSLGYLNALEFVISEMETYGETDAVKYRIKLLKAIDSKFTEHSEVLK